MKQQNQEKEVRTIMEGRGSSDSDMGPEIGFKRQRETAESSRQQQTSNRSDVTTSDRVSTSSSCVPEKPPEIPTLEGGDSKLLADV